MIACLVLGGVAYLTTTKMDKTKQKQKIGNKIFDSMPINSVARVVIESDEGTVDLKKGENHWVVANRFGYQADFNTITDIVKKIHKAKSGRQFNGDEGTLARLGLIAPDSTEGIAENKGLRIQLKDKADKPLLDLVVGKNREGAAASGGQYVRRAEQETVYLIDQNFKYVQKKPAEWIKTDLLDIDGKNVEEITCLAADSQTIKYRLKRPEKGKDGEFIDPPEGKKTKPYKVNNLFRALSNLTISDIADPMADAASFGFDETPIHQFSLFDGTRYSVKIGKAVKEDEDKYYCKISCSFSAPPEKPVEKAEKSETTEPSKEGASDQKEKKNDGDKGLSPQELAQKAEELNQRLRAWVYVISKWKKEDFVTDSESFFEADI